MSRLSVIAFTVTMSIIPAMSMAQTANVDAGKTIFKKCMACHNVENDKSKVGPSLMGLIGRQPGTYKGFKYSKGMVDFGVGKVWDEALLKTYLPNPKGLVKGTKMAFPGLKKDQEVLDVIAYLKLFSPQK